MKYHLLAHNTANFVKIGDKVEQYKTKVASIGTAGGAYYAHLHHSASEGLTQAQLKAYTNGWDKDIVEQYYSKPDTDYTKMFGRKMDVGNAGYGWLQWNGKGFHPGLDINGLGGGNTDVGYEYTSPCDGVVVFAGDWGKGWGKVVVIEESKNLNTSMNKDFVKEIEAMTGEDYGDNLNDNEQKEIASRLKAYREKQEKLIEDGQKVLIEAQKEFSMKLEDEKRAYDLLLDAAKKDSDKKNETIGIQKETIDGLENTLKNLKDGTPYIWNGDAFQGYTCDSTDDMTDVEFNTIGSKIVAFFNKLLNK